MNQTFCIDNDSSYKEFISFLEEGNKFNNNTISDRQGKCLGTIELGKEYKDKLELDDIIHGKNKEINIVNISVKDNVVYLFKETDGKVSCDTVPYRHWVLGKKKYNETFKPLKGNQAYRYIKHYDDIRDYYKVKNDIYSTGCYTIGHFSESFMVEQGHTYFKGMKPSDLSLLSFDIETTSLDPTTPDAKLLLITNTFRKGTHYISKTFCVNDYDSEVDMISAWSAWVRELDPSLLVGHNIMIFDIPYILGRNAEQQLYLGRNNEPITVDKKPRELRKDGSQSYTYNRINCFGREIVDTFFLSIKFDIGRKYESYGLKSIIKQEGLEAADRQHYDASKIKQNWGNPEERKKIIAYAEDDSRDPIKLFDLMIPSFFYLTSYIPKPFQLMIESATGSQLNALMVRSYIQKGFSVATADPSVEFEGAISFGNPGIYKNVFKVDIASLYPSIMRYYKVSPGEKDYNNNFLKMLNYFTEERLKNKKLAKETKERYYDDLQNAMKVAINSAYGFMGAKGLNYNNPSGAAAVTRYGREIITKAVDWAKENNFIISNCDTDSISFSCNKDLSEEERFKLLNNLNALYPSAIRFEDDGYFKTVIILKAKNYILDDGKKVKLKGSSIKDNKKELALREMIGEIINRLLTGDTNVVDIYNKYIKECYNVQDIKRWATKKTITKAILDCKDNPEARLNERKVYNAVIALPSIQEGDKVYVYPNIEKLTIERTELKNGKIKEKVIKETALKCVEFWNKDEDKDKLVERIYDTIHIFENVLDTNQLINYTLVKNKPLLNNLLDN